MAKKKVKIDQGVIIKILGLIIEFIRAHPKITVASIPALFMLVFGILKLIGAV
jgi:hypothetical protein